MTEEIDNGNDSTRAESASAEDQIEAIDLEQPASPLGGAQSDVAAERGGSLLPFEDLVAPEPLKSAPPQIARWLALGSTLLAGLLGGMVGYGVGDLTTSGSSLGAALGGALGGITAAVGVGIVANLTLRAMHEWKAVEHPEADEPRSSSTTKGKSE